MNTSGNPATATLVDDPPPGEVRLAISMNGGVSLAVWMGGVTSELLELIRSSDHDVGDEFGHGYRQLLAALDQTARVDVIAGASAGGINGVLLALAVAQGLRDLSLARTVWIEAIAHWLESSAASERRQAQVAELADATRTLTWWTPALTEDTAHDFTGADWTVRQLLAIEMLYSLGAPEEMVPQEVELGQISAFARDHLAIATGTTHRNGPGDKLTGVRTAHFAAFYRRSWRANDWMWGRLDAADRLTAAVFDRDQLVRSWAQRPTHELQNSLKSVATSTRPGREQLGNDLNKRWDRAFGTTWNPDHPLGAELGRITRAGTVRDAEILDEVRNMIVLRRQAEITIEEIPHVAAELRRDLVDAGNPGNGSQQEFLRKADRLSAWRRTLGARTGDTHSTSTLVAVRNHRDTTARTLRSGRRNIRCGIHRGRRRRRARNHCGAVARSRFIRSGPRNRDGAIHPPHDHRPPHPCDRLEPRRDPVGRQQPDRMDPRATVATGRLGCDLVLYAARLGLGRAH